MHMQYCVQQKPRAEHRPSSMHSAKMSIYRSVDTGHSLHVSGEDVSRACVCARDNISLSDLRKIYAGGVLRLNKVNDERALGCPFGVKWD